MTDLSILNPTESIRQVKQGESYIYRYKDGGEVIYRVMSIWGHSYHVLYNNGASQDLKFGSPINIGSVPLNKHGREMSHYEFLDKHFNTILERMDQTAKIAYRGNFSASGDKYYSYRDQLQDLGIPWFHIAAMYHLMELLYSNEVRETRDGWVHPTAWIAANYKNGHNLSQYMNDLE